MHCVDHVSLADWDSSAPTWRLPDSRFVRSLTYVRWAGGRCLETGCSSAFSRCERIDKVYHTVLEVKKGFGSWVGREKRA